MIKQLQDSQAKLLERLGMSKEQPIVLDDNNKANNSDETISIEAEVVETLADMKATSVTLEEAEANHKAQVRIDQAAARAAKKEGKTTAQTQTDSRQSTAARIP